MNPDPHLPEEVPGGAVREPPLAGIRVLDLSRVLAGPYATMIMGDLGAEVIKVERPGAGDDTRHWGPPFVGPEDEQESTYYLSVNRNKRSLELDLKAGADQIVLQRLLEWADVMVENFRPGVMDRLGLTTDALRRLNPRLVTLTITGFGSTGPDRDRVAYDQILQAEGGVMSLTGEEPGRPLRVGVPIADLTAGMYGTIGVLAALRERDHSGLGQRVETSLLGGQIAIHCFQGTRYLVAGEVPQPSGNHHPTVSPYGSFAAADGQIVLAVGNERAWQRFAKLLELPAQAPAYTGNHNRVAHRAELTTLIEQRLAQRNVAEWMALFAAEGVPAGEVKALDRVYASEQVHEQGLVVETVHRTLGTISLPGTPLRFNASALAAPIPPPTLGEQSAELRARFAPASVSPAARHPVAATLTPASAGGLLDGLADQFEPFESHAVGDDPLAWPGYTHALQEAREHTGQEQAVVTGRASIGGGTCVLVAFNFAFIGGSMGEAEGERIVAAAELAARERLPLVTVLRSGGARMQEGMRALIQMSRVAASLARLTAANVPHISVARHPTTGGVWASIGAGADLILAESGAQVAFAGSKVRDGDADPDGDPDADSDADSDGDADTDAAAEMFAAEGKLAYGFVDAVLPLAALRERLAWALELLAPESRGRPRPPGLPEPLGNGLAGSGWAQVKRARRIDRPRGDDYLEAYLMRIVEIHGDRVGGVDASIRCGFGRHGDRTIAFVSQSGEQTSAAGYRTAARLIGLADRMRVPILTLIDSPGADGSVGGELAGVGTAIAMCFRAIAEATVPILSVTVGQGGSGGSLALAAPNNLWMTTDSYFAVINPESAAAILKRPKEEVPVLAEQLRVGPEELRELGVVRGILG